MKIDITEKNVIGLSSDTVVHIAPAAMYYSAMAESKKIFFERTIQGRE